MHMDQHSLLDDYLEEEKRKLIITLSHDNRTAVLKTILWKKRRYRILYQQEWGPCWIISIINSYILMDKINFDEYEDNQIQITDLIKKLSIILTKSAYVSYTKLEDDIKSYCLRLFTDFHKWSINGIGVNCHFSSIDRFGKCDIYNIISSCGLKLYHLMVPNFEDVHLNELIRQHDYSSLYNLYVNMETKKFCVVNNDKRIKILKFLNTRDQGLAENLHCLYLKKYVENKTISILYYKNHFSTIIMEENEIYVLLTDLKYINIPNIVFKKLNIPHEFYNGNYKKIGPLKKEISYLVLIKTNQIRNHFTDDKIKLGCVKLKKKRDHLKKYEENKIILTNFFETILEFCVGHLDFKGKASLTEPDLKFPFKSNLFKDKPKKTFTKNKILRINEEIPTYFSFEDRDMIKLNGESCSDQNKNSLTQISSIAKKSADSFSFVKYARPASPIWINENLYSNFYNKCDQVIGNKEFKMRLCREPLSSNYNRILNPETNCGFSSIYNITENKSYPIRQPYNSQYSKNSRRLDLSQSSTNIRIKKIGNFNGIGLNAIKNRNELQTDETEKIQKIMINWRRTVFNISFYDGIN